MTLSTHALDASRGIPAADVPVAVFRIEGDARTHVAETRTDADGRASLGDLRAGSYELVFTVGAYFARSNTATLYDAIPIRFVAQDGQSRYHIPLLLSPWSYSTYRGS